VAVTYSLCPVQSHESTSKIIQSVATTSCEQYVNFPIVLYSLVYLIKACFKAFNRHIGKNISWRGKRGAEGVNFKERMGGVALSQSEYGVWRSVELPQRSPERSPGAKRIRCIVTRAEAAGSKNSRNFVV